MDNRCDTDNSVGARAGEQLHDGRVYSHPAGNCSSYSNDGRGRYKYWNFSATTHRVCGTSGCDSNT